MAISFPWLSFQINLDDLSAYLQTTYPSNYAGISADEIGFTVIFTGTDPDDAQTTIQNFLNTLTADGEALSIALEAQTNAVNAYRDGVLYSGFTYTDGYVYDSDPVSVANITATLSILNSGVSLPSSFTWRTQNNTNVPYTSAAFIQFATSIFTWGEEVYVASWTKKAAVAALTTAADVLAYDVTAGWPANNYTP